MTIGRCPSLLSKTPARPSKLCQLHCGLAMALRRLLSMAAPGRLRSSGCTSGLPHSAREACAPAVLACMHPAELRMCSTTASPATPPTADATAADTQAQPEADRSALASQEVAAPASAPDGAPGAGHGRMGAGRGATGSPASPAPRSAAAPGQASAARSRPPRGDGWWAAAPRADAAKAPFGGTRRAPPPAPSAGGVQAEALPALLGPPQFERLGKVDGRYTVPRTPEFAIVELGPAQYKARRRPARLSTALSLLSCERQGEHHGTALPRLHAACAVGAPALRVVLPHSLRVYARVATGLYARTGRQGQLTNKPAGPGGARRCPQTTWW